MPIGRITNRSVDALQQSTRDVFLWDPDLKGFGVKVTRKNGVKKYVVQYRIAGLGRRAAAKRVVLGTHGTLTPEEARKLARRELSKVAQGTDPAGERATRKATKTVAELWSDYIEHSRHRLKENTRVEYERMFKQHVAPALGGRLVPEVDTNDVRRLHRSMHDTPYVANRVAAMLGGFFTYAWREGVLDHNANPAHGIEFYKEAPRERFLTPIEFRRLGEALTRAERDGLPPAPEHRKEPVSARTAKHRPKSADTPIPASPYGVAAIRLLALTGCREGEILSLKWDDVDLERGYLRLSETKTGKSVRPLGQAAGALLGSLPRFDGNPHVLPGTIPGQHLKEIKRLWHAVRSAAELKDVRIHDLRHSFASVPASSGESLLVVRSLLGHKRVATTERYAHLGDDPAKRAADRTAASISGWLGGEQSSGSATEKRSTAKRAARSRVKRARR
jgi:integrase